MLVEQLSIRRGITICLSERRTASEQRRAMGLKGRLTIVRWRVSPMMLFGRLRLSSRSSLASSFPLPPRRYHPSLWYCIRHRASHAPSASPQRGIRVSRCPLRVWRGDSRAMQPITHPALCCISLLSLLSLSLSLPLSLSCSLVALRAVRVGNAHQAGPRHKGPWPHWLAWSGHASARRVPRRHAPQHHPQRQGPGPRGRHPDPARVGARGQATALIGSREPFIDIRLYPTQ